MDIIKDITYDNYKKKCCNTKFSKTTMHYYDTEGIKKKIKITYDVLNDRMYHYDKKLIYGKEIIPQRRLMKEICNFVNRLDFIEKK